MLTVDDKQNVWYNNSNMKYLVFDIECCNGSDICSFGFVLTDESFNVIEQRDILINPENRFILTNRSGTQGISLAYKKEHFYASPKFPFFHEYLKKLIEDEECYKIGFAISNDAGFLNKACSRYKLEPINFTFFDIQRLDAKLHNNNAIRSLGKIIDEYGIEQDDENILHKSDDDAFFTLTIFRRMLAETGKSFEEILKEYPDCEGKSFNFGVSYNGVAIGNKDKMRKKDNIIFYRYTNELFRNSAKTGALKGKKLCFSRYFTSHNYRKMLALAPLVINEGGRFTQANLINYYIKADDMSNSQIDRLLELNPNIEVVTLEEFLPVIGLTQEKLMELEKDVPIDEFKKKADELPQFEYWRKKK